MGELLDELLSITNESLEQQAALEKRVAALEKQQVTMPRKKTTPTTSSELPTFKSVGKEYRFKKAAFINPHTGKKVVAEIVADDTEACATLLQQVPHVFEEVKPSRKKTSPSKSNK